MITLHVMNAEENDSNGANNIPTESEQWHLVLWTDDSRLTLDFHNGRICVYEMPSKRKAACSVF